MPQFISKFDDLCTHFPNMDEDDKIHRFLTKVDVKFATELAVDPSTRQRWNSFLKLKEYAANYAATLVSNAALLKRPRAGALNSMVSTGSEVLNQNQWEQARPRKQARPSSSKAAASAASSFKAYSNSKGESFSRHQALVRWCHGNSVCICCFAKYDNNSASRHRQHCTATPKPDKDLPPGYSFKR